MKSTKQIWLLDRKVTIENKCNCQFWPNVGCWRLMYKLGTELLESQNRPTKNIIVIQMEGNSPSLFQSRLLGKKLKDYPD